MDQTDRRILQLLKCNARMSATAIGEGIHLSRTAVQDRIKRLEARKIIKAYTIEVEDENQGQIKAIIFVKFATRPCAPILKWLRLQVGVLRVTSLSGEIDAIIEVAYPDTINFSEFSDTLMESPDILEVKTHIVLSD